MGYAPILGIEAEAPLKLDLEKLPKASFSAILGIEAEAPLKLLAAPLPQPAPLDRSSASKPRPR